MSWVHNYLNISNKFSNNYLFSRMYNDREANYVKFLTGAASSKLVTIGTLSVSHLKFSLLGR